MLRQAADEQLHLIHRIHRSDAMLGEDVDHARCEAGVRDDRDPLQLRSRVELLLLEHDLRVTAEISEVHAGLHRQRRQLTVEVVRDRAQHRLHLSPLTQHDFVVTHLHRDRNQAWIIGRQKRGQRRHVEVGQPHLRHAGTAKQVERTGGALCAPAKDEKTHIRESVRPHANW